MNAATWTWTTGLRRGELLGLKWTGIDFQRKTLRIQRRIARQNGGNVKTVSGMMGHYSAGFTLDTYAHVTGDMQRQAAQVMDTFMTDIFGKELTPWQSGESPAAAAST